MSTPSPTPSGPGFPLLALGFRPFFLAAGTWAVLSLVLWLAMLHGWVPLDRHYGGTTWHAHEMLFGYGLAVVAGFLLTATRNWTGMATATGPTLGGLVLLWLAGRLAPLLPVPGGLVAALDAAFPLVLAGSLYRPLWHGSNPVNRLFPILLLGMGLASLLVHLEVLGVVRGKALAGDRLMLGLLLTILLVVAGRVVPFFCQAAIPSARPRTRPWVERITFALALPWVGLDVLVQAGLPLNGWAGALALAMALVQGLRLAGWHDRAVWSIPILWVLFCGYLWLILGLLLNGLAHWGLLASPPALHGLTVGALGVITLGMMGRVTLGHTGRAMRASAVTVASYLALNLAAALRVFGPLLWPAAYGDWLWASGLLWVLAFGAFLGVHGRMLVSPRADGRAG